MISFGWMHVTVLRKKAYVKKYDERDDFMSSESGEGGGAVE